MSVFRTQATEYDTTGPSLFLAHVNFLPDAFDKSTGSIATRDDVMTILLTDDSLAAASKMLWTISTAGSMISLFRSLLE